VTFTIVASAANAPGALHYDVEYGDGSNDADAVPQYCVASPGPPASETWTLSHRYAAPGTYTVSVTVAVNCSAQSATATLTVSPTAA
jgi:PKD repeat protein